MLDGNFRLKQQWGQREGETRREGGRRCLQWACSYEWREGKERGVREGREETGKRRRKWTSYGKENDLVRGRREEESGRK